MRSRSPLHKGDLLLLRIRVNARLRPVETSAFRFEIQQESFRVEPTRVSGERSARPDNPVAGKYDAQRVRAQRGTDRPRCLRTVDLTGQPPVRRSTAVAGVARQVA